MSEPFAVTLWPPALLEEDGKPDKLFCGKHRYSPPLHCVGCRRTWPSLAGQPTSTSSLLCCLRSRCTAEHVEERAQGKGCWCSTQQWPFEEVFCGFIRIRTCQITCARKKSVGGEFCNGPLGSSSSTFNSTALLFFFFLVGRHFTRWQCYSISIWGSCRHIRRVWLPTPLPPRPTNALLSPDVFSVLLSLQLAVCLFLFLTDIDAVYSGMQVSANGMCISF